MKNNKEELKTYPIPSTHESGGAGSAGQSGDTQGLPDVAQAGFESIQEMVEEGQYSEAETLLAVEEAADGEVAELHPKQVPQDDVSFEPESSVF